MSTSIANGLSTPVVFETGAVLPAAPGEYAVELPDVEARALHAAQKLRIERRRKDLVNGAAQLLELLFLLDWNRCLFETHPDPPTGLTANVYLGLPQRAG